MTTRRTFLALPPAAVAAAMPLPGYLAGSDVIRVGVIGCGGRGAEAATQAMDADKGVRIVAMGDLLRDRAEEKRAVLRLRYANQVAVDDDHLFGGFDAYKHVIESSDVVLIANAAKFHPLHMRYAVEAGRHVFVEKPHAIDPAGLHAVREACDLARQKQLSVLSGLQSRFFIMYREIIQRIHDGAIGEIVAGQETWLRGPYVLYPRRPGLSEIEHQASNQYHFNWLSGDDVPQTLIHNLDRALWALNGLTPLKAWGMGGRSTLQGEVYGNVFDHHSVTYEFASGARIYAHCRTIENCHEEAVSLVIGTKGRAFITQGRIDGERPWEYTGPKAYSSPAANPYKVEHVELFKAIREGRPINSGNYMIPSTHMALMGQFSCYTGKSVSWEQLSTSRFFYPPRPEDVAAGMEAPVRQNADNTYPVFVPGVTQLL